METQLSVRRQLGLREVWGVKREVVPQSFSVVCFDDEDKHRFDLNAHC